MTGVYRVVHRRVSDAPTLMCSLMILVSVLSMAVPIGYAAYAPGRDRPDGTPGFLASPTGRAMLVRRIFEAADTDGDGRISQDEASRSAALFVRSLDASSRGSVDE